MTPPSGDATPSAAAGGTVGPRYASQKKKGDPSPLPATAHAGAMAELATSLLRNRSPVNQRAGSAGALLRAALARRSRGERSRAILIRQEGGDHMLTMPAPSWCIALVWRRYVPPDDRANSPAQPHRSQSIEVNTFGHAPRNLAVDTSVHAVQEPTPAMLRVLQPA